MFRTQLYLVICSELIRCELYCVLVGQVNGGGLWSFAALKFLSQISLDLSCDRPNPHRVARGETCNCKARINPFNYDLYLLNAKNKRWSYQMLENR